MFDGVKVAVVPLAVTVPATPLTVNVALFTVDESIPSLKVAVMEVFLSTPVTPSVGFVEITIGGVVSVGGVMSLGGVVSTGGVVSPDELVLALSLQPVMARKSVKRTMRVILLIIGIIIYNKVYYIF